jgi:hypothetical protein
LKRRNLIQDHRPSGDRDCNTDRLEKLKEVPDILRHNSNPDTRPIPVQETLNGLEGLESLASAMTILLLDSGGTAPEFTCDAIAEEAPDLYEEFGEQRVLALCSEIQYSEIPEQSALFQGMFQTFNTQFFAGRLPYYRVLVVYDVWYWETERLRLPPCFPPAYGAHGFIDFAGRHILIRFLAEGVTMLQTLIHEMAHAATDGGHGDKWKGEMLRLKLLGAPTEMHFRRHCGREPIWA